MAAITSPNVTGAPAINVKVVFPRKFQPLLESTARYLFFFGGRGGAKSWQIARALLIKGLSGGYRVLCAREVQSSLKESVKQLLSDQIKLLGLSAFYKETKDEIRGPDGTLFFFKGLSDPEALKSAESIDCVWLEEARTVTKASWVKLDPTIRKAGAQIIISMNPELETDFLYDLFIKRDPPPGSVVVKVGYEDNPWISPDFIRIAEHLKATDYDEWLWIYGGACRVALDGAVYAHELRAAAKENRICHVPLEKSKPVHVFSDLGRGDSTAFWFVQIVGLQYRIVGYYENRGLGWDHYLTYLETQRQERGWFYGTIWLPHDADNHTLGARRTIKEQTLDANYRARIVPKIGLADGINAARSIFPMCWFSEEHTSRGRQCLAQYHYEIDDDGTPSKLPEHDWSSHGCLVAGTPVRTSRGLIAVEQVLIGDRVWTPAGWSEVTNSGAVKRASELVEIETGGRTLRCTPEHKILTNRGFVTADGLRYSDRIFSGREWQCRLIGLFSRATPTGFRATITGEMSGARMAPQTYIAPSGKMRTGLSLRGWRSTISMATRSTTTSPILSCSTDENISAVIALSAMLMGGSNHSGKRPEPKPQSGTPLKMDVHGTASMGVALGKLANGMKRLVSSAVSYSARLGLRAPSSATPIAKLSRFAFGEDKPWVYDLTVKRNACYQASGLLVSNSDGFRYMGVALREDTPKPKKAPVKPTPSLGRHGWLAN